ncbi:MAG: HEAT repeat domain-containing protein [Bryobacteraceae bacterium]
MKPTPQEQLVRLASDSQSIYEDAWEWFRSEGPSSAPVLVEGLGNDRLGLVCHWRILLLLREFALPSTLPAILAAFRKSLERKDPIVLPGAMEALAVFPSEEAASALISVLSAGGTDDVKHAAALLGQRGDARSVEALGALLENKLATIRQSAISALKVTSSSRAGELLKKHRARETDPGVLKSMP